MIINKTLGKIISQQEIRCRNVISQNRGLMFRKKQNLLMIFPQERKIKLHNFFVFYPIDLLVIDKEKKIVDIKRSFKPFAFWNSPKRAQYVLELGFPSLYEVGDLVEF